jgi:hypothetical protein
MSDKDTRPAPAGPKLSFNEAHLLEGVKAAIRGRNGAAVCAGLQQLLDREAGRRPAPTNRP